jgi:hypothetical protein
MTSESGVFISYTSADRQFASELANELRNLPGVNVILDLNSVELGASDYGEIAKTIRDAQVVVVLLSKHLKNSQFVHSDVAVALKSSSDRMIVPVLLDEEGRENLVWPLVADRVTVGPNVHHIRAIVESALRLSGSQRRDTHLKPRVARGRLRLKILAPVAVILLVSILLLLARNEPEKNFGISIAVEDEGEGVHRGSSLHVGQRVIILATETDLLCVYRDGRLVQQCPGDLSCTRRDRDWKLELIPAVAGTYRIIQAAGVEKIELIGVLEQDLPMLDKVARELGSSFELTVR